jgi:CubicO group peptidase (beta-lactamase class C family)
MERHQGRWRPGWPIGFCLLSILLLSLQGCGSVGKTPTVTPTPSPTPRPLAAAARIDAYLRQLAESGHLSGAVLVAEHGSVFRQAYGFADSDARIPNTTQTDFRLGSLTKQFTAMAILILQERGKLHVQDRICLYVPQCPQAWQPITIQELLTHTSGIPDYTGFHDFPVKIGQAVTPEQLIARFKSMPLRAVPGTQLRYSNSGYVVLGYIIERVTGTSYADFMHKNIFLPLKMYHTGYDEVHPQLPEHATGYYQDKVRATFVDISEAYSAGGLTSNVEDMYLWDQALTHHLLVSQAAYRAMFTPYINCPPPGSCSLSTDLGYGYGWFIAREPQDLLYYHTGGIDGYISYNGIYPNRDVDVIVLSNVESTDVMKIGLDLAAQVFQGS